MSEVDFAKGLEELQRLTELEYHEELGAVASDSDTDRAARRVGRLVGVMLKEPFATANPLPKPSSHSQAYWSWELGTRDKFEMSREKWQYKALDTIRLDLSAQPEYKHLAHFDAYRLAETAQNETGFFGYFAAAVRRYICGDRAIRRKVASALRESRTGGVDVAAMSPVMLVASGGAALGVYLVSVIPILGIVGVPVIVAIVLILYRLGVEGFCDWSKSLRTNEDE